MSGRIVAVVPVRSLRDGKSRLAPVLAPEARERLVRYAAERVIRAAVDSGTIETVLVVSPDPEALAWAAELSPTVSTMPQPHHLPGLNGAIDAGREWARTLGATAIVSLFADLPLIGPGDIRALTGRPEAVVLGPDRRGEGTNALLLRLAGRGPEFRFAFGERSLVRHLEEARRLGVGVAVHNAAGIGFDLDTPGDWTDFLDAPADHETLARHITIECGAGVG
ncbi:MAG: 2-phospho-L-lactate guanylyltransferase [Chloroflexi bacterium]|nr:2-phospho-L-lactate guanylyltransferase [Chloroflexota bacterium]